MHAVGQQSTVETLCITVAKQRNNGSDQGFLCGLTPACVTSEYSGRAAVFREELQSCRRTDPAILEERQRVKMQCEDSASEL
jgi:hypothetical protein